MERFRCRALRRSGASEIRIIAAPSIAAARERLIAAGLEPIDIEPVGASLFDGLRDRFVGGVGLPAWPISGLRRPGRPARIMLGLCLSIPFTVAIGAWSLAALTNRQIARMELSRHTTAPGVPQLSEAARRDFVQAMSRHTVGAVTVRLAALLPQDASVHALAGESDGHLTIGIDTRDPDRLRAAVHTDTMIGRLPEVAQDQTDDGMFRVTLRGIER